MKKTFPEKVTLALALDNSDNALLEYAEYLNRRLDFTEINAVHVMENVEAPIANFANAIRETEAVLEEKLEDNLSGQCYTTQSYEVKSGDVEETLIKTLCEKCPDLFLVGKDNKKVLRSLSLDRVVRKVKSDVLIIPASARAGIQKVLVAVDFSEDSVIALRRMLEFKKKLAVPFTVRVLNIPKKIAKINVSRDIPAIKLQSTRVESRRTFLRSVLNKNFPDTADEIEIAVKEQGNLTVAEEILRYAENNKFDLIAVGARGHTSTSSTLFGSVTEEIALKTNYIPVWSVKP